MSDGPIKPDKNLRHRLVDLLSIKGKWDWNLRVREIISPNRRWSDYGHRLMGLTGQEKFGNLQEPSVKTMYFKRDYIYDYESGNLKPVKDNGWKTTTHYEIPWKEWDDWRAFTESDYDIRICYLSDDGRFKDSAIHNEELPLFYKWFIWERLVKTNWFGIRPWLYYKGLHAAVYEKIPFTCQKVPPRGTGGYDHWFCDVKRPIIEILRGNRMNHAGPHNYINYQWEEGSSVEYKYEQTR